MTDIVERLRIWDDPGETICAEAADEIERLRAALGVIIDSPDIICTRTDDHDCPLRKARRAAALDDLGGLDGEHF